MRFWCRWLQPTADYRPLADPPNEAILGWWRSGHRINQTSGTAILCALVEAADEKSAIASIAKDWPEASFSDSLSSFVHLQSPDWLPGARFPLKGWSKERVERRTP